MHTCTPGIVHIPVGCGKAGAVGSTGPDSKKGTVFTCCVSSVGQISTQTMSGLVNSILKVDITIWACDGSLSVRRGSPSLTGQLEFVLVRMHNYYRLNNGRQNTSLYTSFYHFLILIHWEWMTVYPIVSTHSNLPRFPPSCTRSRMLNGHPSQCRHSVITWCTEHFGINEPAICVVPTHMVFISQGSLQMRTSMLLHQCGCWIAIDWHMVPKSVRAVLLHVLLCNIKLLFHWAIHTPGKSYWWKEWV